MRRGSSRGRHDLHLHTSRSDGCLEPEELLVRCARQGLDVVAMTDHDLASPLEGGTYTVQGRTIRLLEGAEVSGVHGGREFHLLVYFPEGAPDDFRAFCRTRCQERATRYAAGRAAVGLPGVPDPDLEACRGERALTRLHLAQALVEAGHAASVTEAFARFTGDAHGTVPRVTLPFVDAIRIAREAGGVTSWAHPPLRALRSHLGEFADAGLHGIEAIRPGLARREAREARALAARHGLVLTGGSDWHGWSDPELGLFTVDGDALDGFHDALFHAA